jgi:hypothetical protein
MLPPFLSLPDGTKSDAIAKSETASSDASEERQWRVQLHLNPNQSTGSGDNSVEKRCPVKPKSGGCQLLLFLPKI